MAPTDNLLSHDEIWDDTALVESWNDALAEYNKYHSVHVRGGTVGDVSYPLGNAKVETQDGMANQPSEDQPSSDMDIESTVDKDTGADEMGIPNIRETETVNPSIAPHGRQCSEPTALISGPMAILGSVEDETLKKVLMSWYYAGYYTGLYQGQQEQARKRPSKQQENDTKQDDTPSIGN